MLNIANNLNSTFKIKVDDKSYFCYLNVEHGLIST